MTKAQLLTALRALPDDPEEAHEAAEKLLLEYINDADIGNVWRECAAGWWYS